MPQQQHVPVPEPLLALDRYRLRQEGDVLELPCIPARRPVSELHFLLGWHEVVAEVRRVLVCGEAFGSDWDILCHVHVCAGVIYYMPDIHEFSGSYNSAERHLVELIQSFADFLRERPGFFGCCMNSDRPAVFCGPASCLIFLSTAGYERSPQLPYCDCFHIFTSLIKAFAFYAFICFLLL